MYVLRIYANSESFAIWNQELNTAASNESLLLYDQTKKEAKDRWHSGRG